MTSEHEGQVCIRLQLAGIEMQADFGRSVQEDGHTSWALVELLAKPARDGFTLLLGRGAKQLVMVMLDAVSRWPRLFTAYCSSFVKRGVAS